MHPASGSIPGVPTFRDRGVMGARGVRDAEARFKSDDFDLHGAARYFRRPVRVRRPLVRLQTRGVGIPQYRDVAQVVERCVRDAEVARSSRVIPTKTKKGERKR